MSRLTKKLVAQRLNQINWSYGRGEIIAVTIAWAPDHHKVAKGIVIRKPWQGRFERRRFRVVNRTLFFLGRQSRLDKPFEV